jgi:hypothetical protein
MYKTSMVVFSVWPTYLVVCLFFYLCTYLYMQLISYKIGYQGETKY